MRRFNPEKELRKIKKDNKNKVLYGIIALLLIVAVGSTYALYQVRHTQKLVFNTVGEFKKRDIYLSVLVDGEYQNDFPTKEEGMLYGGYECDGDAKINFDTEQWQVALYASHPDKCTIKFGHKYVDQSGANYPELYQGMIPVYFENGKIYVADVTSKWYNYDDNKWANAVLIDYNNKKDEFYDDNGNLLGGHEVSEEDILQMYVWIPRYKYQLWNVNNEGKPKQLINIKFETGTSNTGNIKCTYTNNNDGTITEDCKDKNTQVPVKNTDWYTHPAFTFKGTTEESGTELKGIWVGKFEPSDPDDANGRTNSNKISEITILPGKTSMIDRSVGIIFEAEQKLNDVGNKYNLNSSEVDTRVMKNIEWGAVAYLTQSVYGIYKDENTCNISGMTKDNCEVWINNTAQGAGGADTDASYKHGGTYTGCVGKSANEAVRWNEDDGSPAKCDEDKRWNTENGVKASTTGNMYGIYDMVGGTLEHVMGTVVNQIGELYIGVSGFQAIPESKYYDMYTFGDSNLMHDNGHLGDATRETLLTFGNSRSGWNGDDSHFPYGTYLSWFARGGMHRQGSITGIFSFSETPGSPRLDYSSRSVLSAA